MRALSMAFRVAAIVRVDVLCVRVDVFQVSLELVTVISKQRSREGVMSYAGSIP